MADNEYAKEVRIQKDGGTGTVVIGGKGRKRNRENDIKGFARPNKDGGEPTYKAFNINQIKTTIEVRGILSDEIAANLGGNSFSDKHAALDQLDKLFESADLLNLVVEDLNANKKTIDQTGFLTAMEDDEKAAEGNTKFDMILSFLVAEKQGS